MDKIKVENNLKSNTLNIGQVLIIPSSENYITYTVKKKDSLWLIANKYNTTVDKLKKLNNLSSNNLSIGQKLIIPS
ncbi:MAG: LysM peptidoglycan-binding domain-containing protein [Tenericutes bacterium]|nr:LysM peptidoglycan-binding domain-containing protein [Mycoplasmatota bacterium]